MEYSRMPWNNNGKKIRKSAFQRDVATRRGRIALFRIPTLRIFHGKTECY